MESFWHSLKVEETHGQHFATRAQAKHCVFAYIEGFYAPKEVPLGDAPKEVPLGDAPKEVPLGNNTTRMHSSLGYQSQIEFEREFICKTNAANDETTYQNSQSARLIKRAA